jgi:uncharacterized membrane protein
MTRRKFPKPRKPLSTINAIVITVAINLALAGAVHYIPITISMMATFWNTPAETSQSTVTAPYSDALAKAVAAIKSTKQPKADTLPKQKKSS